MFLMHFRNFIYCDDVDARSVVRAFVRALVVVPVVVVVVVERVLLCTTS